MIKRLILNSILVVFFLTTILPPHLVMAQNFTSVLNLPSVGTMMSFSPDFIPTIVRGLTIHPDNPLRFDFIIDTGDEDLKGKDFQDESIKLIKYFLSSLTIPEDELWVNLSPYEKDRIISESFGETRMGIDLLAQDYILKQLTASLAYPEDHLGREFWNRVFAKAQKLYGTTDIPLNTFNKVWIVPDKAVVYEHENSAFIVESHMKVMLEEDYLALNMHKDNKAFRMQFGDVAQKDIVRGVSSEVVREVLIPEIEKEINEGKNFANLRQINNSMILAMWYKGALKESLLGQVYVDQNKTKGIEVQEKSLKQDIYKQYLDAFKQGVYDYIKEDYDFTTQQMTPRKYFSGGYTTASQLVEKIQDNVLRDPLPEYVKEEIASSAVHRGVYQTVTWEAGEESANIVGTDFSSSFSTTNLSLLDEPSVVSSSPTENSSSSSEKSDAFNFPTDEELLTRFSIPGEKFLPKNSADDQGNKFFEFRIQERSTITGEYVDRVYHLYRVGALYMQGDDDLWYEIFLPTVSQKTWDRMDHLMNAMFTLVDEKRLEFGEILFKEWGLFLDKLTKAGKNKFLTLVDLPSFIEAPNKTNIEQMRSFWSTRVESGEHLDEILKLDLIQIPIPESNGERVVEFITLEGNRVTSKGITRTQKKVRRMVRSIMQRAIKVDPILKEKWNKVLQSWGDNKASSGIGGVTGLGKAVGGINLNRKLFDLQIKRDGNGVPLPIHQQQLENINIEGFSPVIINITPTNVSMLLGMLGNQRDSIDVSYRPLPTDQQGG